MSSRFLRREVASLYKDNERGIFFFLLLETNSGSDSHFEATDRPKGRCGNFLMTPRASSFPVRAAKETRKRNDVFLTIFLSFQARQQ